MFPNNVPFKIPDKGILSFKKELITFISKFLTFKLPLNILLKLKFAETSILPLFIINFDGSN